MALFGKKKLSELAGREAYAESYAVTLFELWQGSLQSLGRKLKSKKFFRVSAYEAAGVYLLEVKLQEEDEPSPRTFCVGVRIQTTKSGFFIPDYDVTSLFIKGTEVKHRIKVITGLEDFGFEGIAYVILKDPANIIGTGFNGRKGVTHKMLVNLENWSRGHRGPFLEEFVDL